jgi:ABC-type lipoprotein release transport system permease subunit
VNAAATLRAAYTLEDLGIRIRALAEPRALAVEKEGTLVDDALTAPVEQAAQALGLAVTPYFTYLANSIRVNGRQIPYSLITASGDRGVWLNDWAARELSAKPGDIAEIEYFVWEESGALSTAKASFPINGVSPVSAFDRAMAPEYPGISDSEHLTDWDPPFPMDLNRIGPRDEAYWDRYRTTPKMLIPLREGQKLWRSRFGNLTSLRLQVKPEQQTEAVRDELAARLRAALDPAAMGLAVYPLREQGLGASRGATDFSEYFVYFSFFLLVSAVMLVGLFFKLSVEQRSREVGVLRTLGFTPARLRGLFLREGLLLAVSGGALGIAGAAAYGWLILVGLRTWWVGAVGTTLLTLHVNPATLVYGFAGGLATSAAVIVWTLRGLEAATPRGLVLGSPAPAAGRGRRSVLAATAVGALGLALLAASAAGAISAAAGFFGAGSLLLVAALCAVRAGLGHTRAPLTSLARLGFRNATFRPGRSTLCIALIASATFILVAVDAFRRAPAPLSDRQGGHGGFPLMAESLLPIVYDLNSDAGRENLNLTGRSELAGVRFTSFRLRPGDDASCLNLYEPRNPRVLGAPASFLREGRFTFQSTIEPVENPWLLLEKELPGGAVPAIADANSMTYVLHRRLGEDIVLNAGGPQPVRLRLVAALADSILQGELIIAEKHFVRLFPGLPGFRFFLLDAPPAAPADALAGALSDYGIEVVSTRERLDTYHRVENTYLSTFQTLGGLGLVLGTLGLAVVLWRNVLEQRRELALLRAVGYRPGHLAALVLAENIFLLLAGLLSGTLAAMVAIAPALAGRGGHWPLVSWGLLLPGVLIVGLGASALAVAAAVRLPILSVLRSE